MRFPAILSGRRIFYIILLYRHFLEILYICLFTEIKYTYYENQAFVDVSADDRSGLGM